jgi:phosphatidylserine/phosphatidylglycerophosphate/cardiolipin synthase-like enzyme
VIPLPLARDIDVLVRRAHGQWLQSVCAALYSAPDSHCLACIVRESEGVVSWRNLGVTVEVCRSVFSTWEQEQHAELLWTGPSPASQIPARRIDQVLYDLVDKAEREILLVTFAAHTIWRLADGLAKAIGRGVAVRLILEFEQTSEGQLSMDALNAFPDAIKKRAQIYFWPLEKRERNAYGKPGKLHAKAAIVDDQIVLSSANLTDDAFTRNLELGALLSNPEIRQRLGEHFEGLCANGTLRLLAEGEEKPWSCSQYTQLPHQYVGPTANAS